MIHPHRAPSLASPLYSSEKGETEAHRHVQTVSQRVGHRAEFQPEGPERVWPPLGEEENPREGTPKGLSLDVGVQNGEGVGGGWQLTAASRGSAGFPSVPDSLLQPRKGS